MSYRDSSVDATRHKRTGSASTWKHRDPIREAAQNRAARDGDQAKSRCGNADTGIQVVQEQHDANNQCSRKSKQGDSDCHGASVDHVKESVTRATMPRPKPTKKPIAVTHSISCFVRPERMAA
jgi:hypothetical protein